VRAELAEQVRAATLAIYARAAISLGEGIIIADTNLSSACATTAA